MSLVASYHGVRHRYRVEDVVMFINEWYENRRRRRRQASFASCRHLGFMIRWRGGTIYQSIRFYYDMINKNTSIHGMNEWLTVVAQQTARYEKNQVIWRGQPILHECQ